MMPTTARLTRAVRLIFSIPPFEMKLMKLKYFYCTTPLGILERTPNGYKYTSNVRNEQRLKEGYLLTEANYGLWNSSGAESSELFPDIERVLDTRREDIWERAGVTPQDSKWEKLVKISQLPTFPSGFFLRVTDDTDEEWTACDLSVFENAAMQCNPELIAKMIKDELVTTGGKNAKVCLCKFTSYENCMGTIRYEYEGLCPRIIMKYNSEAFRKILLSIIREHINDKSIKIEMNYTSYDERKRTSYDDYGTICHVIASIDR